MSQFTGIKLAKVIDKTLPAAPPIELLRPELRNIGVAAVTDHELAVNRIGAPEQPLPRPRIALLSAEIVADSMLPTSKDLDVASSQIEIMQFDGGKLLEPRQTCRRQALTRRDR